MRNSNLFASIEVDRKIVERGFGIPDRAAKRTGGKAATVGVAIGEEAAKKMIAEPLTDYIVVVKTP